jgi:hypothetical protein
MRYAFDEKSDPPFLEIDGRTFMIERTEGGLFFSHDVFEPYDSLERLAHDLILFSADLKPQLDGTPSPTTSHHHDHGGHGDDHDT